MTTTPNFDNGRGFFRARLYRLQASGGWVQIGSDSLTLGNDSDDGHWSGSLRMTALMDDEIELFRIDLFCQTRDTSLGTEVSNNKQFVAVQGSAYVGDFSLDYLPISIVYCPPNQDMTASLQQSVEYGTRLTIGTSETFQASTTANVEMAALGVKMGGVAVTGSQSVENRTEAGIEIGYFRNTVLTADNQRAIGRAYWGPLADIFVIAVNPRFAVDRRADGTLFYSSTSMDQIIVVPAYKLLRPGDDPVVTGIPADVRRRLLELDPFLTRLDDFFPDSGAPLSAAVNSEADPAVGNRAERLGRWWLNNATELNYSIGESKELKSGEATETEFVSTVTVESGFGVNLFDIIGIGAQVGNTFSTSVRLQSSKETVARTSTTAACYLIRNQNAKDLDGIEIYFDKLFSTLMFRKVPARRRCVRGLVRNAAGLQADRVPVILAAADGPVRHTLTDADGRYSIEGLEPGSYRLTVGDQVRDVEIPYDDAAEQDLAHAAGRHHVPCFELPIEDVRPVLDLNGAPLWDVVRSLRITSDAARQLARHRDAIFDEADLAHVVEVGTESLRARLDENLVHWFSTPLNRVLDVSADEVSALEQAGVDSAQELWRRTRTGPDLERLAAATGIDPSRLRRWSGGLDASRASVVGTAPTGPAGPAGCLGVLLDLVPWLGAHMRRRRAFAASRVHRSLFAGGDRGYQRRVRRRRDGLGSADRTGD